MRENRQTAGKVKMVRTIVVDATWDPEAGVWVAQCQNLALVTEARTIEELKAKLPGMIQDLLEDDDDGQEIDVPFELIARSTEHVRVRSRA